MARAESSPGSRVEFAVLRADTGVDSVGTAVRFVRSGAFSTNPRACVCGLGYRDRAAVSVAAINNTDIGGKITEKINEITNAG